MQQVLNNINLISLNITLWQGKKTLKEEDLSANGIDITKLPPGSLANLGSKKTIAPDDLSGFMALKREATTLCLRHGVRFGSSGFAIPVARSLEISTALAAMKVKFADVKKDFMATYTNKVDAWIAQNPPEWAQAIRNAVDRPAHVSEALTFNYSIIKIDEPAPETIAPEENGLEEEVGGLHAQLCREIRAAAKIAFESSYSGKKEIGRRALRPIISMREKLEGMLFLDPEINTTIVEIDAALAKVDGMKTITGQELDLLSGLVGNRLMNMGKKVEYEAPDTTGIEDEPEEPAEEVVPASFKIEAPNWDF